VVEASGRDRRTGRRGDAPGCPGDHLRIPHGVGEQSVSFVGGEQVEGKVVRFAAVPMPRNSTWAQSMISRIVPATAKSDVSRNRSRMYCDTGNCGNRQHVAAYRARQAHSVQQERRGC